MNTTEAFYDGMIAGESRADTRLADFKREMGQKLCKIQEKLQSTDSYNEAISDLDNLIASIK